MSYSDHISELAESLADLVGHGAGESTWDDEELRRALASRDIVLRQVQTALIALTRASRGEPDILPRVSALVTSPPTVLRAAVVALPLVVSDRSATLADIAAVDSTCPKPTTTTGRSWHAAARAALQLEGSNDILRRLPGGAAWSALTEWLEIADAVALADGDLAEAAKDRLSPVALVLADHPDHALVRLAARMVREQTAGAPQDEHRLRLDEGVLPFTPVVVRSSAELLQGLRTLEGLIDRRAADLSALDLRMVDRLLLDGFDRVSLVAGQHNDTLENAAAGLAGVRGDLARVVATRVQTLAPPDPRIRLVAGEVVRGLRAATERPAGEEIAVATAAWVIGASHVARATARSVMLAERRETLLFPYAETSHAAPGVGWMPDPCAAQQFASRHGKVARALALSAESFQPREAMLTPRRVDRARDTLVDALLSRPDLPCPAPRTKHPSVSATSRTVRVGPGA